MTNVKKLREALKEYRRLAEESDRLLDFCEENPEDDDLDEASDEAYRKSYAALEKAANMIMDLIKTDAKTARAMILKDNKLDALLARVR